MNKLQLCHNKIRQIKRGMMQELHIVSNRLPFEMLVQEKRSY